MNEQIQNSTILQHHGILGQKWGVRRTEAQLAKSSKGTTSSKKVERNKVKSMSDSELRQRLNRMQMERQYSQLTKKEFTAGQKFINDVFRNAAKQTLTNYASKYMTKGVYVIIENIFKK